MNSEFDLWNGNRQAPMRDGACLFCSVGGLFDVDGGADPGESRVKIHFLRHVQEGEVLRAEADAADAGGAGAEALAAIQELS